MKSILPIPTMIETVININDLVDSDLNKEVAVFILGSFVYEIANQQGERKFSDFITKLPSFKEYLNYFLENEMLVKGKSRNWYKYHYDVDWSRSFELYSFDSALANEIIQKRYRNFNNYLLNIYEFLKPNHKIA